MDEIVFDSNWYKVKKTENGFFFGERKGVNSIAVLPYFYSKEKKETRVIVRFQPMPLDNGDDFKLFPSPITGTMEDGVFPIDQVVEELQEEADICWDDVLSIKAVQPTIATTQMNEVVKNFFVEIKEGSYKETTSGDGSVFEGVSCNLNLPLSGLLNIFFSDLTFEELLAKEGYNLSNIGETPLAGLPLLTLYIASIK